MSCTFKGRICVYINLKIKIYIINDTIFKQQDTMSNDVKPHAIQGIQENQEHKYIKKSYK